jgi:hypothetical protein
VPFGSIAIAVHDCRSASRTRFHVVPPSGLRKTPWESVAAHTVEGFDGSRATAATTASRGMPDSGRHVAAPSVDLKRPPPEVPA